MYKRILVTLDGSTTAESALPHAVAHAQRFQAELILLRVVEPLQQPSTLRTAGKRAEQVIQELARDYLERIAADVRAENTALQVAIVTGRPYREVVRFAENNQVDLIVMSTRGQSGVSRWLLGSVSDRVARGASVPVLLVPSGPSSSLAGAGDPPPSSASSR
jgi:nucleotide-binding universal stress UspA family protein